MKAGFLKSWLMGVGVCTESDGGKNAASRHASARGANWLNITGATGTNQQPTHFYGLHRLPNPSRPFHCRCRCLRLSDVSSLMMMMRADLRPKIEVCFSATSQHNEYGKAVRNADTEEARESLVSLKENNRNMRKSGKHQ
jgi:hypothetical protein